MAFEPPLALKRLVIHSVKAEWKAYAFSPLILDLDASRADVIAEEIGTALAQTYADTDFESLTMGLPIYLWVNEKVLENLYLLEDIAKLKGLFIPISILSQENWPSYAQAIHDANLEIIVDDLPDGGIGAHTTGSTGAEWAVLSARKNLVSATVEDLRSKGFKILVSDAPRSFFDGNVDLGEAYLGPMYYGRRSQQHPLAPGEAQCLEALRLLSEPNANLAEVSAVLSLDPEMTIRVLHLANSAAIGSSQRIDSLTHAIVYLGAQRISSLVMTSMISARLSDPHTMWSVLTRASVCRTLANNAEAAYTAGLLSALAEEVGEASESMAIRAGVSFEVSLALSSGVGDLGALIDAVRAYERADIPEVIRHGWDPVDIADAYFRALPTTYEYLKLLHSVSAA
jgi:EAL and modified HD-GYP domain-containing signal transduction protein